MRTIHRLALIAGALAISACGASSGNAGGGVTTPGGNNNGGNPGGTPGANSNVVTVGTASFSPGTIQVAAGTTVAWSWNSCTDDYYYGQTCVSHNVVFDDGSGLSSGVQSEGTFTRTFNTAGTFKYHCSIHGPSMSGQIVVN